MDYTEEAVQKLTEGSKAGKFDKYASVMKSDVCQTLIGFCRQDGEFAQAVAQGGSFEDCMKAVSAQVKGNGISDMKAYGAAVAFYFPGAGIDVQMTIDLCASVKDAAPEISSAKKRGVILDLSKFF